MTKLLQSTTTLMLAAIALSGCCTTGSNSGQTNPPSALCSLNDDDGNPIPATFTGTVGTTQKSHAANHVNQILSVNEACCAGFDRLVFAVDGIHEPTYTVQYVSTSPTDCGSGNTHNVSGNAFLSIKMTPAQGHGNGQATLPRDTTYNCPNLKALAITCDFESDLTFVVGLQSKKPYRVVELQNPTRLVVDIQH